MSIVSFNIYKEKFERLLSDKAISDIEFESLVEDLIYQIPLDAKQLERTPFLIRTSVLDKNEVCTNIERCSYVPDSKKDIIPLQRCNFEKQQVFYAIIPGGMTNFGDGAQTSLLETVMQKIKDDSTFDQREAAASRWQINKQPTFWSLPHFSKSLALNENFKFLHISSDSFLKNICQSIDDYKNFSDKLNYLSELFCKSDNKQSLYKITATFFNKVITLFKPYWGPIDALIYASANTNGEGMNIVLTKEYVDKKNIYCDLVVLYKIFRNPNNNKDIWFLPHAQATPDKDGNLEFNPIPKNMFD